MSEEQNEEGKKRTAGASFEQVLKSALEKAPAMAVPSWATMQTAMAGGAAGGAAAASWRWIIGPAASAALIGGVFWFVDQDGKEEQPVEAIEIVEDAASSSVAFQGKHEEGEDHMGAGPREEVANDEGLSVQTALDQLSDDATVVSVEKTPVTKSPDKRVDQPIAPEPEEVPADWAELPTEKVAAFGVDIQRACVGTQIGFRMARPMKDVRVLWNFGDGQFSSKSAPQHTFNAPGTYDITLSVTRISDGLIRTRTIDNLVTIHPNPEADFTWSVPNTANKEPLVELRDRSRDAASVMWVVDGAETEEGKSVSFVFPRVGEHRVQLVASSPNGCQSVADHLLVVGGRFGLGGSARFSPDGDGRYDTFLPRKLLSEESPFVFRIEDETGHIVFETTVPKPWDGSLPSGEQAKPGDRFAWTAVIQGDVGPSYFSDEVVVE